MLWDGLLKCFGSEFYVIGPASASVLRPYVMELSTGDWWPSKDAVLMHYVGFV